MSATGPSTSADVLPPRAVRAFGTADQQRFAAVTGDWNPIHVDQVAARRTVAGKPVVHGVHTLLWVLDALAAAETLPTVAWIDVSFVRFLPVGEVAAVQVMRRTPERLDVEVIAGGVARCTARLRFGAAGAPLPSLARAPLMAARTPADLPVAAMPGLAGGIPPAAPAAELAGLFPAAARWLGAERLAALGACTRLVGMTCPGLHSLFSGVKLAFGAVAPDEDGTIGFAVHAVRHGLVMIDIAGGGMAGQITAAVRAAPHLQPSTAELVAQVTGCPFAGQRVLVAGGSRGLGELAAKLLAAGGADVAITWSAGETDAAAVADDIRAGGGRCATLRYQIGEPLDLDLLPGEPPTHGYFFVAPVIARPSSSFFDAGRLAEFQRFFVDGFWQFALALRIARPAVRLFYPSTVYVGGWPRGLAEYAMAKAAGEILCAEMNARLAPLTVVSARLPRLPTDQTVGVMETEIADPVAALLPLIREMQAAG